MDLFASPINLMEACHICQSGKRTKLTPKNYYKWSVLMLDHLREHQEVLPSLCSKIPPSFKYLSKHLNFMYNNMSKESFAPLLMASFPHDVWMALYGDPNISTFHEDIISLVTPIMVP